jgi:N-methylhydantoinase B
MTQKVRLGPVKLEVMRNAYMSVPDEMGAALRRTAFSPNIKERMDASCAIFDAEGRMIAQAEHIPVHLGSMPLAIQFAERELEGGIREGDHIIVNDPYLGGSHLNDITMIRPVYRKGKHIGYAVNKAHHSDVGGSTPGSMGGATTELHQEGLIVPPVRIVSKGQLHRQVLDILMANTRTPDERRGDIMAQLASNDLGAKRLASLVDRFGPGTHRAFVHENIRYSERLMRAGISRLPAGTYTAEDFLEGDGLTEEDIRIVVQMTVKGSDIHLDFTGTDAQRPGNVNTPYPVAVSSVYFAVKCVAGPKVPPNHGCYLPIHVTIPVGCLLNPRRPAAVSSGNVETSQRVADVVFKALAEAAPGLVGAQSQGTMNNLIIGGLGPDGRGFTYYETLGGGEGARPDRDGMDGVHTNMTNTANTPIEALELAYPLRVEAYGLVSGSGGAGRFRGGLGIERRIRLLADSGTLSIQSERRRRPPEGLAGGQPGRCGDNSILRASRDHGEGVPEALGSKVTLTIHKSDLVIIRTPGGGGYGPPSERSDEAVRWDRKEERAGS